jgi:hypothetical protein
MSFLSFPPARRTVGALHATVPVASGRTCTESVTAHNGDSAAIRVSTRGDSSTVSYDL